ncbi:MAG: 50S ribosomal protein L29 [Deltaproteobacteria bacterium]|nr:50S ribosomal protein L29 [Deltaproteobacteria bacterium]
MKPSEVRGMSPDEMKAKETELAKELFSLRMRHTTNQLENPLKLRAVKRDIARMKTIIAEKGRAK